MDRRRRAAFIEAGRRRVEGEGRLPVWKVFIAFRFQFPFLLLLYYFHRLLSFLLCFYLGAFIIIFYYYILLYVRFVN